MADIFMCSCCMSNEVKLQHYKSREIDKTLNKERIQFRRTVRILLLGAGESGKSTFLKQMKIIHGLDFSETALEEYRTIVYNNVVKGMRVLIDARQKLQIPWQNKSCDKDANHVFAYDGTIRLNAQVFSRYVDSCQRLWNDTGIRNAFDRRREFQLVSDIFLLS